jgi:hypothetical protein
MSTTFSVYPKLSLTPTFRQIVDLSTERLNQYLSSYGIRTVLGIEVVLRKKEPDVEQPVDLTAPCSCIAPAR